MKIKNTSKSNFNLASGKLIPGQIGEATYEECKVLFSSNKAVVINTTPIAKKMSSKVNKDSGY